MYPDPKRLREKRHTVRFDDYDDELLRILSKVTGSQPSTLIRELAMRQAEEMLVDAFFGQEVNAKSNGSLPRVAG
jgi:predicted DNA-binding protein